ncbi:MAG: ribonuclease HII [Patescibacteria group bacterium]
MIIVGIDEVGRGCWAGPVVAGAVALNSDFIVPAGAGWKLGDSKLLSKKQRELTNEGLRALGVKIGLGWVDAATVDKVGITTAVKMAMEQALQQIKTDYDEVIIDGNLNFLSDQPKTRALVKADASTPAVSAASIVAKVARDNYMAEAIDKYPDYGFEQHVGYGTALHLEKLKLHGITDLHRKSFKPIKAML